MKISRSQSIFFMAMAAVLWSTGGLLVKSTDWHPMAIAGARSTIASLVIFFFMYRMHRKSEEKRPLFTFSRTAILGGLSYTSLGMMYVLANKLTSATNAIVLQFTSPIWLIIFSIFILKKHVRKEEILTVAVVFFGIVLFFIDALETGHMLGNVIAVFSGMSLASMVLFMKHDPSVNPIEITLIGNVVLALIGIGFVFTQSFTPENILVILLLGIFQLGLPFVFFSIAIRNLSAVDGVLIPILEPILNPLWVFLLRGETVGMMAIVGALIVIGTVTTHTLLEAKRLQKA